MSGVWRHARAPGPTRAGVAGLLLLGLLWSALHGLVGAWVVPALASGPVVQVCTPQGMQWVRLDAAAAVPPTPQAPANAPSHALACPCAAGGLALTDPPSDALAAPLHPPLVGVRAWVQGPSPWVNADTIWRVLLMAPMRAPPG